MLRQHSENLGQCSTARHIQSLHGIILRQPPSDFGVENTGTTPPNR